MHQLISQDKVNKIVSDITNTLPANLNQQELFQVISQIVCKSINAIDPKAISNASSSVIMNELKKMGIR